MVYLKKKKYAINVVSVITNKKRRNVAQNLPLGIPIGIDFLLTWKEENNCFIYIYIVIILFLLFNIFCRIFTLFFVFLIFIDLIMYFDDFYQYILVYFDDFYHLFVIFVHLIRLSKKNEML